MNQHLYVGGSKDGTYVTVERGAGTSAEEPKTYTFGSETYELRSAAVIGGDYIDLFGLSTLSYDEYKAAAAVHLKADVAERQEAGLPVNDLPVGESS